MKAQPPTLTSNFGPIHPDAPETRQAARRAILTGARDAADALLLMKALGLDSGVA